MIPRFSRRRLLAAALPLTAAGLVRAEPPMREERPLRVGMIGVGNHGVDMLVGVETEEILALCDVDSKPLAAITEWLPEPRTFSDFREMLELEGLEAVVICTPDHTHAAAASRSLARGLHVYCEKPLAGSIEECRHLAAQAEAAKAGGVVTQFGTQHRASDGNLQAIEWLRSGRLGRALAAHAWSNRPVWPQGIERPSETPAAPKNLAWDLWLGPAAERPYHPAYAPIKWRGWFEFGTGVLGDQAPHLLDPLVWGLELGYPSEVRAESPGGLEETFPEWSEVRFTFPRGEGPAFELTWYDGGRKPAREITGVPQLPPSGMLILCERANLFVPVKGGKPIVLPHEGEEGPEPPEATFPRAENPHALWIQACRGSDRATHAAVGSDFCFAAQLTEICLLGNLAIRSGEKVRREGEAVFVGSRPAEKRELGREPRAGWELAGG